jgi:hypothetical protein
MAVKFKDVPASWRYPLGPYRQAPVEYGGEWWLVDFTTSEEPWLVERAVTQYPAGFLETFGQRPKLSDYRGLPNPRALWDADRMRWEQDLRFLKIAGWPTDWPEVTPALVEDVSELFRSWHMGTPRPYLGRYDWRVRFPESQLRNYEAGLFGVITAPHLDIARYQIRLLNDFGIVSEPRHSWVPPQVWPADKETLQMVEQLERILAPAGIPPGIAIASDCAVPGNFRALGVRRAAAVAKKRAAAAKKAARGTRK